MTSAQTLQETLAVIIARSHEVEAVNQTAVPLDKGCSPSDMKGTANQHASLAYSLTTGPQTGPLLGTAAGDCPLWPGPL